MIPTGVEWVNSTSAYCTCINRPLTFYTKEGERDNGWECVKPVIDCWLKLGNSMWTSITDQNLRNLFFFFFFFLKNKQVMWTTMLKNFTELLELKNVCEGTPTIFCSRKLATSAKTKSVIKWYHQITGEETRKLKYYILRWSQIVLEKPYKDCSYIFR